MNGLGFALYNIFFITGTIYLIEFRHWSIWWLLLVLIFLDYQNDKFLKK